MVSFLSARSAWAQEACSELVRHGLYDRFRQNSAYAGTSVDTNALCSSYSSLLKSSTGAGGSASYGPFGASGTYTADQLVAVGQMMCSASTNDSFVSNVLNTLATVVDSNAIQAFRACVDATSNGLRSSVKIRESDQGNVVIEVRYVGLGDETTIQDVVVPSTLHCRGPLWDMRKGAGGNRRVQGKFVAMSCDRDVSGNPLGSRRVLAPAATLSVMTDAGTVTAFFSELVAGPPPLPASIPVGSIVPFFGSAGDAAAQAGEGWVICDGRPITDVRANARLRGKNTPNLNNKFLRGAGDTAASGFDGKDEVSVPAMHTKVRVTGWDGANQILTDPRVGLCCAPQAWQLTSPLVSEGSTEGVTVKFTPSHMGVIYLMRMW